MCWRVTLPPESTEWRVRRRASPSSDLEVWWSRPLPSQSLRFFLSEVSVRVAQASWPWLHVKISRGDFLSIWCSDPPPGDSDSRGVGWGVVGELLGWSRSGEASHRARTFRRPSGSNVLSGLRSFLSYSCSLSLNSNLKFSTLLTSCPSVLGGMVLDMTVYEQYNSVILKPSNLQVV